MLALFIGIFVICWIPIASMITGVALVQMWDWFVVPLGIAPIGVAHAIGLSLLVNFVIHTPTEPVDDKESVGMILFTGVVKHLVGVIFVLLIGWIVQSYM